MGKPYPAYTHCHFTHWCHPDVAVFVVPGKAIVISEIHVLNLTIHKHRHKIPGTGSGLDSQQRACVCFNLTLCFMLQLISKTVQSMTKSLIPPLRAHTMSLPVRQVPYNEELQIHGQEGFNRQRQHFPHQSLEPETLNPTWNLSHYIRKLTFEFLYTKVK